MADSTSVALVGSETLLGREIRDIVATSDSGLNLHLIGAAEEEAGKLTVVGDEPAVVVNLQAETVADARVLVLAAGAEVSRKALEIAGDPPDSAIVDLSFIAEERPEARLRAPMVEPDPDEAADSAVHVIAHPAAIALALFLRRLQINNPILRSIIHILIPASEHGRPGIEELQQQTANLLTFKPLPKDVFDAQISFNLLASYGQEAPASLDETELRIERHLATLLDLAGEGEGAPMPSLRVIQAPVFHGYSFSAWVEFEESPDVEDLESSLAFGEIDVRGADLEPPNNVGQAGMSGISIGGILPDRNAADACWFWLAADNLRLAAENAVAVVRQLV